MNDRLQHISHSFRTDAGHLLEKAEVAFTHSIVRMRTSFQAKLVVDAYMSAECSLKSLICSTRPTQDATAIYRLIRDCGHNLTKLLSHAGDVPISSDDKSFLLEAVERGVSIRYSLDLFSIVSCELIEDDSTTFTIDASYVNRFFGIAKQLTAHADKIHKSAFSSPRWIQNNDELKTFVEELRGI